MAGHRTRPVAITTKARREYIEITTSKPLGSSNLPQSTKMASQGDRHSVYVGNMPYQVTEDDIGNFFSQAGNVVNVKIVYDRETGRPKGFGFVDFADEAGVQNAINTLNGADFNGRQLRVNAANK